jgi:hypothetical protein
MSVREALVQTRSNDRERAERGLSSNNWRHNAVATPYWPRSASL